MEELGACDRLSPYLRNDSLEQLFAVAAVCRLHTARKENEIGKMQPAPVIQVHSK